jgi:hypothetical protein
MTEPPPTPFAELLPPSADSLDPDQDLQLSGIVQGDADLQAITEDPPQPFGKSWQWDDVNGCFARFGSGPAETHGEATMLGWIRNLLTIARTAHPIFDDDIGLDDPWMLLGQTFSPTLQHEMEQQIIDALSIEPRFHQVKDFAWMDDGVGNITYSFTIVTDEGEDIRASGSINP